MSHLLFKTTLFACLATGSLAAHADNVKFSGYANGDESVNVSLVSPNLPGYGTVDAGGFSASLNGGASFTTFCIDLYQGIGFGGSGYTDYSQVSGSSYNFINANASTDLGKLFSEGNVVNNAITEAAFQIAVWEITYETSGAYSLANGSATFSGGAAASAGSLSLATSWLNTLSSTTNTYNINVLKSPTYQDQVFAVPAVPEPSTYALLAGGLFSIGFVARRRKSS